MATKFADRAFISVNSTNLIDLESGSLKQIKNAKAVPTMTDDGYNRGFVQGNLDIDINVVIAVENKLARAKLEAIDYENNDVSIVWNCGVDQFVATKVFNKDAEDNAGGVGTEVKATFNFGALKLTDSVGNSSLFNIQL